MTWRQWAERECRQIDGSGLWRAVRDFDAIGTTGRLEGNADKVVAFASNDYLGLSLHPAVVAAAHEALDRWGVGAGAARLIVGSRPIHSRLEIEISKWKKSESALLFPTGFQANLGVISTMADEGCYVCSDELNHASIIDACRLARAETKVFPHKDMDALESLLRSSPPSARRLIVSETVFSMDGDAADVDALAAIAARYDALLVLDEAHAVLGPEPPLDRAELLRVGTLSKFLGSHGGYVAGPSRLIDLITNRARSFIFTTAAPPAVAAAALAAVGILRSDEGAVLEKRLRRHVERLKPGHPSPIIPIVVGDEDRAIEAADLLLREGLLVPAIRPPSVPRGASRLRVTVSASHTSDQVDHLVRALATLRRHPVCA